jgi:Na+/alanine symporter
VAVTNSVLLDFTIVLQETATIICWFYYTADYIRYTTNPQENVALKIIPATEMLSNSLKHGITSQPIST